MTTETQNKILKFQIQKKLFQELNNISPKQFHISMFFSKVVLPFGNTYLNKSLAFESNKESNIWKINADQATLKDIFGRWIVQRKSVIHIGNILGRIDVHGLKSCGGGCGTFFSKIILVDNSRRCKIFHFWTLIKFLLKSFWQIFLYPPYPTPFCTYVWPGWCIDTYLPADRQHFFLHKMF